MAIKIVGALNFSQKISELNKDNDPSVGSTDVISTNELLNAAMIFSSLFMFAQGLGIANIMTRAVNTQTFFMNQRNQLESYRALSNTATDTSIEQHFLMSDAEMDSLEEQTAKKSGPKQ